MRINHEIIDDCLTGKPAQEWRQQWVFHAIVEGRYLREEVPDGRLPAIRTAAELLEREIAAFRPLNRGLWDVLFPAWPVITAGRTVFLVAGCPAPYDAMVRSSPAGEEVLLLDLGRLLAYTEDPQALVPLARKLLTHEDAHTCLHLAFPAPGTPAGYLERLQYLCFDEGLAHFLSFRENVASVDWSSGDSPQRRDRARARLREAVRCCRPEQQVALLEEANAGPFWEKFGAIAGLFAWAEASGTGGIPALYRQGPRRFLPGFFTDTAA